MIFRFLENENEMIKSLPEMMFEGDFEGDIFFIFFKVSLENISDFRHFIGIFNVSGRLLGIREIF